MCKNIYMCVLLSHSPVYIKVIVTWKQTETMMLVHTHLPPEQIQMGSNASHCLDARAK